MKKFTVHDIRINENLLSSYVYNISCLKIFSNLSFRFSPNVNITLSLFQVHPFLFCVHGALYPLWRVELKTGYYRHSIVSQWNGKAKQSQPNLGALTCLFQSSLSRLRAIRPRLTFFALDAPHLSRSGSDPMNTSLILFPIDRYPTTKRLKASVQTITILWSSLC